MSDTLAKICNDKREYVAQCKELVSFAKIEKRASEAPRPRGFADRLQKVVATGGTGLIGEIKKASPSKGLIREDFAPAAIARAYAQGGATCLSVLTDIPYFQGRDDYLTVARMATSLPVLRKDFILEPYQVFEARSIGADCILLIMAALEDAIANELAVLAGDLAMDVLIEVHNPEELRRACEIESRLLGINNRNLKTLEVNISTSEELAILAPKDRILVAESGLNSRADLDRMAAAGANCVLVGESLMRQADVMTATRILLEGDALKAAEG